MNEGLEVYPDVAALARATARHFIAIAEKAIAARRLFAVALSGGSTPRRAYQLLCQEEFAARIDWAQVHIFWGDERCVPPDHPDNNYRMARETLLDHVPIPAENVHRMRGEMEPLRAAAEYERELRGFFSLPAREGQAVGRFDLVLLGMGSDGHTASLFPHTQALHEEARWVVAQYVDKLGGWRLTLTPPMINAAANVTFLISGADKAERLRDVFTGPYRPEELPAQIVKPHHGRLRWLVDAAAAAD